MKIKILVVDDEFHTCELLAEKIRSFDFEEVQAVLCAGSGEEALRILQDTPCQILITDICMSPMDGLELISKAKKLLPELMCILLSAFDKFSYAQKGIQLRIRDYWLKPCSAENMRKSLCKIIGEYRSNQNKSKAFLDTVINEAVTSEDKTVTDIFHETSAYPGNVGYVVAWDGTFFGEISLPGFWIYRLLNGRALFACPVKSPSPEDMERLKLLPAQVGRSCGVSLPGGQVSELYRQAKFALSLKWVWECRTMIFYDEQGYPEAEAKAAADRMFMVNRENIPDMLKWIEEQRRGKGEFSFASYVDRIYRDICNGIAEMTGKPPRKSMPWEGKGWKIPIESALREMAGAKSQQMDIRKRDPIRWSVEYVARHYGDDNLDMTMLADTLGISYQYFSELFHKQMGAPFSKYILELRMKEACLFLLQGETVSDVSQKVGYQHVRSFTRAFKRMYGVSPNNFRNMKG